MRRCCVKRPVGRPSACSFDVLFRVFKAPECNRLGAVVEALNTGVKKKLMAMDLRTQTSLFCAALALAIAASVLLRGKPKRAQWFFAAFAVCIGLWYLAQWLYLAKNAAVWARFTAGLALLMPQFALHLFEAIFPQPGRSTLLRVAHGLLAVMLVVVLSPVHDHPLVRGGILLYVFGLFAAGLWSLLQRGERSRSRATQRRVRFLVVCGALAASLSLADFLWFVGAPLPPVGAVLSLVFLFVLAESLSRARLVDLYDMAGLALVSTALAFSLGGIFYVFVVLLGGFQTMYLNAVLGGIVMLVLFEPLRDKIGVYIHRAFLLERFDLDRAVARARQELTRVLDVTEMQQVVIAALEDSRRVTAGTFYLRDSLGAEFEAGHSFGGQAPPRVEGASLGPLIEHLEQYRSIDFEALGTRPFSEDAEPIALRRQQRVVSQTATDEKRKRLLQVAEGFGELSRGVCVGIFGARGDLLGLLLVRDDRVSDAFSGDDLALLESLAVYISVVIENSLRHLRLQEGARLSALGQLAAGLAHEIKNPLGAIKGAAQYLNEAKDADPSAREFLEIIVEEVDRLDRVVGSVLDYARPTAGTLRTVDVHRLISRTLVVLRSSREYKTCFEEDLDHQTLFVRADPEQLKQVLINLFQNAIQAMNGAGEVVIRTRSRSSGGGRFVEIAVSDRGPGIDPAVMKELFQPFFTTKSSGTGLGLAISERIVHSMAGRIEVASEPGVGATFTVVLPQAQAEASAVVDDQNARTPAETTNPTTLGGLPTAKGSGAG